MRKKFKNNSSKHFSRIVIQSWINSIKMCVYPFVFFIVEQFKIWNFFIRLALFDSLLAKKLFTAEAEEVVT